MGGHFFDRAASRLEPTGRVARSEMRGRQSVLCRSTATKCGAALVAAALSVAPLGSVARADSPAAAVVAAPAPPPAISLDYRAPDGCPDQRAFEAHVRG